MSVSNLCKFATSGCNSPESECIGLCTAEADEQNRQEEELCIKALDLLEHADQLGFNLTITREVYPLNPQMAIATVDVWPKRGPV